MYLFPISTPFFHPTGSTDLFCLFQSSQMWNHRACTGLQLNRNVGTVPLQFTDLASLNKGTQVALYNPKLKRNETQVDLQQRMTWNHRITEAPKSQRVRDKTHPGMGGEGWSKSHRRGGSVPGSKG